ncbi:MAG: hypothetical protein M0D57_18840 [Sphingobacteriales bacterium JAD_PAG50586_3]|nr:MAG: hypothetical protein M0D57_18840 [Sphingobacteriales bacterium JAD_PAG50586_3]
MKKTLPTILLILLTISGFAQISLLDTSYNHIGYWILTDTIGLELECSSADNTGRLVTASSYELIIQHKPDGSYDYATRIYPEDLEHLFDTVLTNYQVYDIAALNTGKTLVVGRVTTPMGHRMVLTQLNNEGSVDTTFANNGSFILNNYQGITAIMPYRIRVQPDGKVILCFFASVNNIGQHTALLRLNTNGTLDNTFNNTGVRISDNIGYQFMLFNQAGDIHVPSLKLIGNNYYLGMTQFNSAGDSLQTKILCPYDIFGQFHMSLSNAVINLHGKMYISAFNYGSTNSDSVAIIAVNTDLTLDNTFANGGIAVYNDPTYRLDKLAIAISPTGQLFGISVGQNSNDQLDTRLLVLKYKNNGQLNTAFDGDGVYYQTPPFGIFYSNSPAMPYYVPQQNKLLATAAIRDYDNLLP